MAINQESKKIQYFIYLKPILFLWAIQKVKKNIFAIFWNLLKLDPNIVIARRSAFSTFPSAWNGVELEDGIKSEELKCQFSLVEGDLNLQKIPKLVLVSNKKASRKKMIMMKDKDEKGKKAGK